jgi:hypothetical protein
VSDQDPFTPTSAGPEPTPVVGPGDATIFEPAGTARPADDAAPAAVDPHPERQVGLAFAGGLVAALFLKSLAKRKHR